MKRNTRRRWIGMLSLGLIAVAAIVVVLAVFAGTNDTNFTATGYSDVIRFAADGVATLQVRIFDLSGKVVWDSSIVAGGIVDWNRNNDFGERLAYGAYIYSAQGWNASGDSIFQKNGKLALMPGDKVQLQAAPQVFSYSKESDSAAVAPAGMVEPKGTIIGDLIVTGNIVSNPKGKLYLIGTATSNAQIDFYEGATLRGWFGYSPGANAAMFGSSQAEPLRFFTANTTRVTIAAAGNVGIGTTSPTAKLEIESSTGQDLIAAYPSSSRVAGAAVFVVKSTGEVRADGAYYSGAGDCNTGGFNAGGADVAERINTSEWVVPGNVVEIDPEHPGFFRKSSSPYSTKVAGIISTSPGVILGNSFDEATDDWEDNRPVLAVTGRVPCKVSAENGAIEIGDLLVASSTPGIAMKGNPERAIGAVVGKAMEPLENGTGTIVVQVLLR